MGASKNRVEVQNVNTGRSDGTIDEEKYLAMRRALLSVVPKNGQGILFKDLPGRVEPLLPSELFAQASVTWYTTTVKLDLEARGFLERIPGSKPQRLRRV